MTRQGLPKRQRLVGVWLLLSGVSLVGERSLPLG